MMPVTTGRELSDHRLRCCPTASLLSLLALLLLLLPDFSHAQARLRLSGLQNCSTYDGPAEFFVQIENVGTRVTPVAETRESLGRVPLGQRVSDRVMLTHDGWPLESNEVCRQADPGFHSLDLKVVTFRAVEPEPQTLLSREVFATESRPLCRDVSPLASARASTCIAEEEAAQLPFQEATGHVDLEVVASTVHFTVLDRERGATEWGLPPFPLTASRFDGRLPGQSPQDTDSEEADDDVGAGAAEDDAAEDDAAEDDAFLFQKEDSFFQVHLPAAVPFSAAAAEAAPESSSSSSSSSSPSRPDDDPVIRVPVAVKHLWAGSGDFVRRSSSVVELDVAAVTSGDSCPVVQTGGRGVHVARKRVQIVRGAGQAIIALRASSLLPESQSPAWRWWTDTGTSQDCEVQLVVRFADHGPQFGSGTVRLVPFGPSTAVQNPADAKWQQLPKIVSNGKTMNFSGGSGGNSTNATPAQVFALEGPVVFSDNARVAIAPRSLIVLGPGVDVHVRSGASFRIGMVPKQDSSRHEGGQQAYFVSSTYVCGLPAPVGHLTNAEAEPWGGIYALGYASKVQVSNTQIVDGGQGWAGNWQLSDDLGHVLPQDSTRAPRHTGPAHLQEKAIFDIRHGAELVANSVTLHGRRGQAVIGMGSSISMVESSIHGFVGGFQLADAVVRVVRSHLSHFFHEPSPMWNDPQASGHSYVDNDNDALYVTGGDLILHSSVVVGAGDDCVDSGTGAGGRVHVTGCWIEACQHEGVALSNNGAGPKHVSVQHTVIRGCQQGVELGFSTALLQIDLAHVLLWDNHVGLRLGDNYGWVTQGLLAARGCAFVNNDRDVLSLHRRDCVSIPIQQAVLAGCLFQSVSALPVVQAVETAHGGASGQCEQLLKQHGEPSSAGREERSSPVTFDLDRAPRAAEGISPRCRNAFADGNPIPRFFRVSSPAAAIPAFEPVAGVLPGRNGNKGTSPLILPSEALTVVPSWNVTSAVAAMGQGGVPEPGSDYGVAIKQPPRLRVPHGQTQQLAEWDVAKRIEQHAREEAALGDQDTRRSTAGEASPLFNRSSADVELEQVAKAMQDLAWSVGELHMFVLWSSTPQVLVQEIAQYLCSSHSGVSVLGAWTVVPFAPTQTQACDGDGDGDGDGEAATNECSDNLGRSQTTTHVLDEEFYRNFYADSYYSIFEAKGQRVKMTEHKGAGAFTVFVVEDPHPEHGSVPGSPEKGSDINKRIYSLKHQLRGWLPRKFQLHSSQNASEAEREIHWMFGASRAELSAQLHRELRALYTHFEGGLSRSAALPHVKNSIGLQSPLCWPRAPAHPGNIAHSRLDSSALGGARDDRKLWAGWAGAWPGGRWGGSTLSGMAVMPAAHFQAADTNGKSLAPKLRMLRPAPAGDVIAVMLKGEWPKLNMDVSTLEKDLDDIIMEPDPYNASQNFQRSVLLGKISLPLALHTPMDAKWMLTFAPVSTLGSFRVLAAKAWPEDSQCRSVRAIWAALKPFVGRSSEVQNLQLQKIVSMVEALQEHGPRIFDWTIVALTHSTSSNFDGPFTLWDGNHRAVAVFGYYTLLQEAERDGASSSSVKASDLPHVRLYVGQSETIRRGHKGTFYCPKEGL